MRNLFDEPPPLVVADNFFKTGFNPQAASPLARACSFNATYSYRYPEVALPRRVGSALDLAIAGA